MKVNKTSNYNGRNLEAYLSFANMDFHSLFLLSQGRIRFGDGTDGQSGENISGQFQVFTSSADAGTQDTITHTLGAVPVGYLVVKQDKSSSLYAGVSTWSASSISLVSSATSTAFTIFLLK